MNETLEELFVRGKYQLARYESGSRATGHVLTKSEVLEAYGPDVIAEIDEHLTAVLIRSSNAIERELSTQRKRLEITQKRLAGMAGVPVRVVEISETNANQLSIQTLEHLAWTLRLDPLQLGRG